ncbi:SH3 domain-containing protein [Streptomyces sp. NBC_00878]|uniref:SH3 domain-containing protein n=1 Tax=Streptomyces sp. NBC_00878 TaxID=2975854 RepID=UPI00225B9885|nr:SH3 domain-containing protein [Streptomyces sp. NBC_00878]MCX4905460.1 SH3 domain-containing protein [Streptomyces sp. NBC_00878]
MSLRTALIRLGIVAAGSALVVGAVGPAAANDDWGQNNGSHHSGSHQRLYKGVVTAPGGLNLRDRPTRSSAIIGFVGHGEQVSIFCKVSGENVKGNNLWYLLADGTWAWATARFIDNIGPAPSWC